MLDDTTKEHRRPAVDPGSPRTTGPVQGTCFGYEVHSSLLFDFLREGRGEPLAVTAPAPWGVRPDADLILQTAPTRDRPWNARLYMEGDFFRLWIAGGGWFVIDPVGPHIQLPGVDDTVRREERLWGLPALLCMHRRGDLPLHAAAVQVDGSALLLAGMSESGKTTLAAGFVAAGHRLLSEDLACVRDVGSPVVIPGPAMLRLRADVADRLRLPGGSILSREAGRVHIAMDPSSRGDCVPVPVRAIIFLRESPGRPRLDRMAPQEAIRHLWPLSFRMDDAAAYAQSFAAIARLAQAVPIWELHRPFRLDELERTVTLVADRA